MRKHISTLKENNHNLVNILSNNKNRDNNSHNKNYVRDSNIYSKKIVKRKDNSLYKKETIQ